MVQEEEVISGASLHGRDPTKLKIPELKQSLACRGTQSIEGKKGRISNKVCDLIH